MSSRQHVIPNYINPKVQKYRRIEDLELADKLSKLHSKVLVPVRAKTGLDHLKNLPWLDAFLRKQVRKIKGESFSTGMLEGRLEANPFGHFY